MVMAVEDSMLRVVVRLRPPTPKELESQRRPVVQVVDERVLVFDPEEPDGGFLGLKWGSAQDGPRKKGKDLTFVFDRVFAETATQQDVFQHTTHSILDSFLQGYNCSGEPACPSAGHQMRKALALPSLWAPQSSLMWGPLCWALGYNRSDRQGSCPLDAYSLGQGEDTSQNHTCKGVLTN